MCGCYDGGVLNWPSLPQLWFCFPFFCFLKKYAFQRVCWKLNYMHSRSSFLFLWFIYSAYFSDYLLSNYHPPGILLLFSCPVVFDSSWPHGPTISQSLPKFMSISYGDAIQPSHPLEKHQNLLGVQQHILYRRITFLNSAYKVPSNKLSELFLKPLRTAHSWDYC